MTGQRIDHVGEAMSKRLNIQELKSLAEKAMIAEEAMFEIGEGVGGLPASLFEYSLAWTRYSQYDHIDTVLSLIAEIERLQKKVKS